jgi:hypothetical protein
MNKQTNKTNKTNRQLTTNINKQNKQTTNNETLFKAMSRPEHSAPPEIVILIKLFIYINSFLISLTSSFHIFNI